MAITIERKHGKALVTREQRRERPPIYRELPVHVRRVENRGRRGRNEKHASNHSARGESP